MIPITTAQLHLLAPNIRTTYANAFATADAELSKFGINATPHRLRHFMAQMLQESGGLKVLWESMNYSAPRLPVVWPVRFQPKGPLDPNAFAHNPEKLGNSVYGNRMGNTATNGFFYRGRGLIQTTGHDGYVSANKALADNYPGSGAPDFTVDPDALLDAKWCLKVAAAEYAGYGCNAVADTDTGDPTVTEAALRKITRLINGGLTGLADRRDWLRKVSKVW